MGVPTASVCMGFMLKSQMPVNLTFAGKHGQDADLLTYACAFENQTRHRIEPPVTPVLKSDRITPSNREDAGGLSIAPPEIEIASAQILKQNTLRIKGSFTAKGSDDLQLEAFIDGQTVPQHSISSSGGEWSIEGEFSPYYPMKPLYGGIGFPVKTVNTIILVRSGGKVAAGKLVMIPQDELLAA